MHRLPNRPLAIIAIALLLFAGLAQGDQPVPPTSQPVRLAVPSEQVQQQQEALVKDTFKSEYAKHDVASRSHLATTLLVEAAQTKDDPGATYALLMQAIDVGSNAGDAETTLDALDKLESGYLVDLTELRPNAMQAVLRAGPTPAGASRLAQAFMAMANQSLRDEDFSGATKWASKAEQAAHISRDSRIGHSIDLEAAHVRVACAEAERLKPMFDKLQVDPGNPEANTAIGQFECFECDNWTTGLSSLALSSDPALKAIAQMELQPPGDEAARLALADAWWAAATPQAKYKTAYQLRAGKWYNTIIGDLTGLTQTRVTLRLIEVAKLAPTTGTKRHLTLHWSCADIMDVYLNGNPLRKVAADFRTRTVVEVSAEFTAVVDLAPGDVITVGAHRGDSCGFVLVGEQADHTVVFAPAADQWRVYKPADEAKWFRPEVATQSEWKPAEKAPPTAIYRVQRDMCSREGPDASCIWTDNAKTAYFYYICE